MLASVSGNRTGSTQQCKKVGAGLRHAPARASARAILRRLPIHRLLRHSIKRKAVKELLLPLRPRPILSR